MHLLLAQKGSISDGDEAIDLGQTPGDILFLSAADTELAAIAAAVEARGGEALRWRLASLMTLKHPMSVDTYVERTLSGAKAILVRLIGGEAYWPYGLATLQDLARRQGTALAILPADGRPDARLGERIAATVVPHAGEDPDPEALRTYARTRLAGYKVPRDIAVRREPLHRTPTQKIDRGRFIRELDA